ncbi:astacin-like metalloendopeptidase [Sebastes fasciatus]|uniref:astacin-like metalloendopeptidase n=1 Tax=Sebastes fasciatus TaxID=394691 RepID=UPI003D9EC7F0
MWTFIVVFVLLTGGHRAQDILHHACPDKHVVSQINSPIDKDRQGKIECKAFNATSGCSWSGTQDKELSNNCPANHVVAGVSSSYNSKHGDRSWKLLCCSAPNFITFECRETPMVNYLTEDFNWELPAGHFLTGVQTYQKNTNGDHRWSFNYCKGTTKDTQTGNTHILTMKQPVKDFFMKGDRSVRNKRNAKICEGCRWSKIHEKVQVPYTISDAFTSHEKTTIHCAIRVFDMTTCIRFVPHKVQPDDTDYISIVKTEATCESQIGRAGGDQELSLGEGCVKVGNIQHELIHALGFWHEQNRSDRDDYVEINIENIVPEQIKNFRKLETNNLDLPYDYSSVMHYARKTFSKNGEDTIEPLDPSAHIGQRKGMSKIDILKINKLYDCKDYLHKYGKWDNKFNNPFNRTCPSGQAVSGITSLYNSDQKDRLWAFSCKSFKLTRTCKWSAHVNAFEAEFNFKCGDNEVISGTNSTHSSIYHDRKWKFYCCSYPGFTTSNCKTTEINDFKESLSWTASDDYFLTGVKSSFDDKTCDRQWTLTYCEGNTQMQECRYH